jgi:hypothetical protein
LSTVQAWDTGHLTTAAQHWTGRATTWESAFTDVYREMPNPGGTSWSGAAADAALLRAHSDRVKVLAAVDQLHDAAATARSGALELDGAKQRVLSAVNSAQSAGYVVTEDLSVGYPRRVSSPAEAAIRQVQAQTMATDIRTRAGTLATLDHKVAADITAKAMGVGTMDFPEAPPGADALSVKNEKDVHRIVDPLPPGRSPGVKMVPNGGTPGLFGTLTENGTPIPPGTYPGQVSVLPDGTRISYRPTSKSGGGTIDIKYPDGTTVKIHEFPAPQPPPAPVPVPAPAPAPVPAPAPAPAPAQPPLTIPDPGIHLPSLPPPPPLPVEGTGPAAAAGGIGLGILVVLGSLIFG